MPKKRPSDHTHRRPSPHAPSMIHVLDALPCFCHDGTETHLLSVDVRAACKNAPVPCRRAIKFDRQADDRLSFRAGPSITNAGRASSTTLWPGKQGVRVFFTMSDVEAFIVDLNAVGDVARVRTILVALKLDHLVRGTTGLCESINPDLIGVGYRLIDEELAAIVGVGRKWSIGEISEPRRLAALARRAIESTFCLIDNGLGLQRLAPTRRPWRSS